MYSVSTGWRGRNEINEVRYDPSMISAAAMEDALRRFGTYVKTLESGP